MKVQAAEEQMAGKGKGASASSSVVSADNPLAPRKDRLQWASETATAHGSSLQVKGLKSRHTSVQMAECPRKVGNPACNLMGWEI